jgi:hypothetical protein
MGPRTSSHASPMFTVGPELDAVIYQASFPGVEKTRELIIATHSTGNYHFKLQREASNLNTQCLQSLRQSDYTPELPSIYNPVQ